MQPMGRGVAGLCVLLAILQPAASRETVPFDFGWKHTSGLKVHPEPYGTEPPPNPDPGDNPPEAALLFDASTWDDISLPHDGLIATSPTSTGCPQGCSGNSFIQRKVLWYRKEFTLPSSWMGGDDEVFLDFEGAFRRTIVWINGLKVLTHESGCSYDPSPDDTPLIRCARVFTTARCARVFTTVEVRERHCVSVTRPDGNTCVREWPASGTRRFGSAWTTSRRSAWRRKT